MANEPAAGPCTVVIFGASGDLTKRLLVPALCHLQSFRLLPRNFAMVGVARSITKDASLRAELGKAARELSEIPVADWKKFQRNIFSCAGDFDDPETFRRLSDLLARLEKERGTAGNVLFYLATPANAFAPVVEALGKAGLLQEEKGGWRRVIVEKPFGRDLASAKELNRQLSAVLREDQTYRIDHYLGKETVQNLLVFRFGNALFEPAWNRNYIDNIQITLAETLGVEGRGKFYETAGALRDVLENHVFVLLALIAMEPPTSLQGDGLRNEMGKVLAAIHPFRNSKAVFAHSARGQYRAGKVDGKKIAAYRAEKNVARDSEVETFAALRLEVDNWRWAGVPFYLRTGKALAQRATRIVVEFKTTPLMLFGCGEGPVPPGPNRLIFDIQPQQAITVHFRGKTPGAGMHTERVTMDFDYREFQKDPRANGYETLIYDAMIGDNTLFHRTDLVETAWRIATPVLKAWAAKTPREFPNYAPGSEGPASADKLLLRDGHRWWTPGPQRARAARGSE
ncbi:MAG: glucose-6-phosphate dehydrogenase [Verrucomicrobiota bacterium]